MAVRTPDGRAACSAVVRSVSGGEISSALRADLLRTAQVKAIASRSNGERRLVLPVEPGVQVNAHYDLRGRPKSYWQGLGIKLT